MVDCDLSEPFVDLCGTCGSGLDPVKRVQICAPCGHRHHFSCLLRHGPRHEIGEQFPPLECGVCGASGIDFVRAEELVLLNQEGSAVFQRYDSDIELHFATELRLGRPVTLLKEVPQVVFHVENLRCLDLTCHPITELPPAIGRLVSLQRLILCGLHLSELPDEVCELKELSMLSCYGCSIGHVPANISKLQRLWSWYMDSNRVTSIPDELPPGLNGLMISGNAIARIPENLGTQCPCIQDIIAAGNQIHAIPDSVCQLSRLRNLVLHGNRLRKLPEAIGSARNITTLLVADNHLESLPDSIADLPCLEWLYAYNNQITRLPVDLLSRAKALHRFLFEANPVEGEVLAELFVDIPDRLRVVGIDARQAQCWQDCIAVDDPATIDLPGSVIVGQMLRWDRLYAKLTRASQLSWAGPGRRPLTIDRPLEKPSDVLVVAFSASQGEPEWFGALGQALLHSTKIDHRSRISRQYDRTFADLHMDVHGRPPASDEEDFPRAAASIWRSYCTTDIPSCDAATSPTCSALKDFDVLCLCDTSMQWYFDVPEHALNVEEKLREFRAIYKRILFIGASMGGFGALSHAHLADTVVAFGPQIDLTTSHLRPGWRVAQLEAASSRLHFNVKKALAQGTRIEYHVATEDHVIYARQLPLPLGALVVHPLRGRIARLLSGANILAPLVINLISELQDASSVRPWNDSVMFAANQSSQQLASREAWVWSDCTTRNVIIAQWDVMGGFSILPITPHELSLICKANVCAGDWFCSHCNSKNEQDATCCSNCHRFSQTQHRVAWPSQGRQNAQNWYDCAFCRSKTRETEGKWDDTAKAWYCHACWEKFAKQCAAMREELSAEWYIEGGQEWAWQYDGSNYIGAIEFDRYGQLRTKLDGTWSKGNWRVCDSVIEVSLGYPTKTWHLTRTEKGFVAVVQANQILQVEQGSPDGDNGKACGWPLYISPSWTGG